MSTFHKLVVSSTAAVALLGTGLAQAQEREEPVNVDSPPEKTTEVAQVGARVSTDAGAGAGTGGSDHDRYVGSFAIGYLGFRQMSVGELTNFVQAPVIGGRFWLSPMLGIDAGLGFSTGSSTIEVDGPGGTTDTDVSAPTTFILHGGVPLALTSSEHFVFEIVPEVNFGLSSMTQEDPGDGPDTDFSGTHLDVGARAGGEVHFGFIDVPQLSLQAGVALRFNLDSVSEDDGTVTTSQSATSISTGVGDNPWNIFTANIAALYYFDN